MRLSKILLYSLLLLSFSFSSCRKKIKKTDDQLYSRHLQSRVQLTILSTPLPEKTEKADLLILNDGQELDALRAAPVIDSLYKKERIGALLVVAVHARNRTEDYGVAGIPDFEQRGKKAADYDEFLEKELLPYIRKQSGIRTFNQKVIAGMSQGGLSALSFAWLHGDKVDKVGVFSGSFWWRDKAQTDSSYRDDQNRILIQMIRQSKKRPDLKYWFYYGLKEETADRDNDGIIDVADDTRDVIQVLQDKKFIHPADITLVESAGGTHDYGSWSARFPEFLIWAFGN